jgi:hypothetical protein
LIGASTHASGTLTTVGNASSFEEVIGITGTYNGHAITGIVPLLSDPNFGYDNLFEYVGGVGHLSQPGIVFDVSGFTHVNVGDGAPNGYYALWFIGQYDFDGNLAFSAAPVFAPPVPEPATYSIMFAGLAALGLLARRPRKV